MFPNYMEIHLVKALLDQTGIKILSEPYKIYKKRIKT